MSNRGILKKARRLPKQFTKENFGYFVIGFLIVAGLGVFFWKVTAAVPFDVTKACLATETYHIHPHLAIFINGEEQTIPKGIGFASPTCLRPLHTHEADGRIHVEYQESRDFTLGEFFRVWGEPFDKDHILSYTKDGSHNLTLTVDGQPSEAWQDLVLRDGQKIVINFLKTR